MREISQSVDDVGGSSPTSQRASGQGVAADLADLFVVIAKAFRGALGDDLLALYAYGSGADGTHIPGFSDLDLAAFCFGMPSRDALLSLARCWGDIEISPFSYLQVRYIDANDAPRQTLVAGSLRVTLLGPSIRQDGSARRSPDRLRLSTARDRALSTRRLGPPPSYSVIRRIGMPSSSDGRSSRLAMCSTPLASMSCDHASSRS